MFHYYVTFEYCTYLIVDGNRMHQAYNMHDWILSLLDMALIMDQQQYIEVRNYEYSK